MSDTELNPAFSIIKDLGGAAKVAEITGKHVSRVYRWSCSKEKGGTGGTIPAADASLLLAHAKKHGLPVTAERFFGVAA